MIDSITSYLYSQAIDQTNAVSSSQTAAQSTEAASTDSTVNFASMLSDEISNYSSISSLADTLSGSVLSTVANNATDLASLSEDLLNTSSGRKVIEQLAEGHLNSIVLTDNDDDDTSNSITQALDSYTESVEDTSSLEDIVNQLATLMETEATEEDA